MMSELYLNKEIYRFAAIQKAACDYQVIATVEIHEAEDGWRCLFTACSYDETQTVKEFANYCIDLMNASKQ